MLVVENSLRYYWINDALLLRHSPGAGLSGITKGSGHVHNRVTTDTAALISSLEIFTQTSSLSCVAEDSQCEEELNVFSSSFTLAKLGELSLGELPRHASHAKAMSHVYKTTDALIIDSLKCPFVAGSYQPRFVVVEISYHHPCRQG